jgi:ribosomal protein S18 acetylase RimI-like enzyme
MEVEVRYARPSDVEMIIKIARKDSEFLGFTPRAGVQDFVSKESVIVAVHQGRYVVGFLEFGGLTKPEWSIYNIAVLRLMRNSGVGKKLIAHMEQLAKGKAESIKLKVTSENTVAIDFYRRNGFSIVDVTKATNREIYVMRKELADQ